MSTIGELAADGVRWRVICRSCGREVQLGPEHLATMFEANEDEQAARLRLRCKRCGARGENYLYSTPRRSYDPGSGRTIDGAWRGIYDRKKP